MYTTGLKGVGGAMAVVASVWAGAAAGAVLPGTTVINTTFEGISAGVMPNTTWNTGITAFITDNTNTSNSWYAAGMDPVDTGNNRRIEFSASANSPFSSGSMGMIMAGDPANNGPQLYTTGNIGSNPNKMVFQFDAKINDTDSFAGVFIADNGGEHIGMHFGNAGAANGKILVPTINGTGWRGTEALADFQTGVWYRFKFTLNSGTATATSFDFEMTPFGGQTQTFTNLGVRSGIFRGDVPTIMFHSQNLNDSAVGAAGRGEMYLDNISFTVVPEPSTAVLAGVAGLLLARRRSRRG